MGDGDGVETEMVEGGGSGVLCSMFYMHACYVVSMYESMIMMRILEDNFSYR